VPVNAKVILFDEVLAPSDTALPFPSVAEPMDVSGGTVSEAACVVNVQTLFAANELPAVSLAPIVMVAVYTFEVASEEVGSKVAVFPSALSVTTPGTLVEPSISVNVEVVMVDGFMASLKVARILAVTTTLVAPSEGLVLATVGFTVSMIMVTAGEDAGEVFPAASLALAVIE
jgi:hypothetical protein